MRRDALPIVILVIALALAATLARWIDAHRPEPANELAEEQLYLSGRAVKHLSLAFNGLAADWYWMSSLQYVGRKIVSYEDTHGGQFQMTDLSKLDLRLLASLLDVTTTLDPQFIPAYEYGAVILPEINPEQAITLLNKGIAANPQSWRLHQHLGYIYWQLHEYERASEAYDAGSRLSGAPAWMAAMAARMKVDAGSSEAAREMYLRLYESSDDPTIKQMVISHLMRLQWFQDRYEIQHVLDLVHVYSRDGRCVSSWRQIANEFREPRWHIDPTTGAPLDPSGAPYRLVNGGCNVGLDPNSKVPR